MPRPKTQPRFRTGRTIDGKPKPRKPMGPRPKMVVDEEALAAIKAQFAAEREAAEKPKPAGTGRSLPVTGACHDCGRAVSGERRFCGTCLARH